MHSKKQFKKCSYHRLLKLTYSNGSVSKISAYTGRIAEERWILVALHWTFCCRFPCYFCLFPSFSIRKVRSMLGTAIGDSDIRMWNGPALGSWEKEEKVLLLMVVLELVGLELWMQLAAVLCIVVQWEWFWHYKILSNCLSRIANEWTG